MTTLRRALWSVAVTLVLLAAIEAACVLALRARESPPLALGAEESVWPLSSAGTEGLPIARDPDLLWRNARHTTRTLPLSVQSLHRRESWTVSLDSYGFRGPERLDGDRSEEARYRVLCIGDSVTFGYDVEQGDTYPSRLEALLRGRYPGRPIEVINAGVPGWSWVQGLRFLQREGLTLRPNLVVAAHGADDRVPSAHVTDSERIWLLTSPLFRLAYTGPGLFRHSAAYRLALGAAAPDASPGCVAQMRSGGSCRRVSPDEVEETIRAMRRLTEEAGADLVIMNVDFLGGGTATTTAARRAAFRDRIPFLDQTAPLGQLALAEQLMRAHELGVGGARVPSIRLRATDPVLPPRAQRVLLRVLAPSPGARVAVRGIATTGDETSPAGEPFASAMYDDGTHGDERAGDAVFSATVHVPDAVRVMRYRFYLDGSPEFVAAPSPPDAWTDRVLRFADDVIAPVELIGARFLMADARHPDASGQRVLAATLADAIGRLPAFRAFAEESASEP